MPMERIPWVLAFMRTELIQYMNSSHSPLKVALISNSEILFSYNWPIAWFVVRVVE